MTLTSNRFDDLRKRDRANQSARIMAQKSASVREVPNIHLCMDEARRSSCEPDLALFMTTYMPRSFFLPWSEDHLTVIGKLEKAVLEGGLFAEAMPRGNGKTTILAAAGLWAVLYGHRRFVAIIGAEAEHAKRILESIKSECSQNDLLWQDFPEVCCPVRHIDGIGQRASGQLWNGKRTHISWKKDLVVFPTIEDSKSSGSVIMPRGLTGSIRGMQAKTAGGEVLRPDLAFLDDPQTEESAKSSVQCDQREELIEKAVLGLAGPTTKISALMACTIIQKGDISDRFLNHERHPEWQGECMKMVYEWPEEQEGLWSEYAQIRREGMGEGDQGAKATEFYRERRERMDSGAVVAWPERHLADELSALQHAENLRIDRGEAAFQSEYQNDPQKAHPGLYEITAEVVASKINGLKRFQVADHTMFVGAFIDINPAYGLNYCIAGFCSDMTGCVIDYGKYPENENEPLVPKDSGEDERQIIFNGLDVLCKIIEERVIIKGPDRQTIDLVLIDCGHEMKLVFQFCKARQRHYAGIRYVAPSRGWGSKRQLPKPVDGGAGNHLCLTEFRDMGKVIVHNADYWRMHAQKAFLLPAGAPGSLSLFGEKTRVHEKFASHVAAEQLIDVARGDKHDSYQWYVQPGHHNDLLDCVVGCCVGASYRGCDPNIQQVLAQGAQNTGRRGGLKYQHHEV